MIYYFAFLNLAVLPIPFAVSCIAQTLHVTNTYHTKELMLGSLCERDHMVFVFLHLDYLT